MPPCDSIILCQVNLELANQGILMDALEKLAKNVVMYNETITFTYEGKPYRIAKGVLVCEKGYEKTADKIKQAYSRECVTRAAKKFGWNVKTNPQNTNKLQLQRRY